MPTYDNVSVDRQDDIAIVTMQRPDRRNSLSDPMLLDLSAALREFTDDASVGAVILTGSDPVFSAGADAPSLKGAESEEQRREVFGSRQSRFRRLFGRVTGQLDQLDQPVVCAINGHAVGGGWGLGLSCDFRFASAEAKFWLPEVDLGTPLGVGSTMRIVRMAGEAAAKEIIMGCHRFTAEEVKAMRLVNWVVPKADLMKEAVAYAQYLAAKPPQAMMQVKANINAIARSAMAPVMAEPAGLLSRDA